MGVSSFEEKRRKFTLACHWYYMNLNLPRYNQSYVQCFENILE